MKNLIAIIGLVVIAVPSKGQQFQEKFLSDTSITNGIFRSINGRFKAIGKIDLPALTDRRDNSSQLQFRDAMPNGKTEGFFKMPILKLMAEDSMPCLRFQSEKRAQ